MVSWANFKKTKQKNKGSQKQEQRKHCLLLVVGSRASWNALIYLLRWSWVLTPPEPSLHQRHICCLVHRGSDIYNFQFYGNFPSLTLSVSVLDWPSSLCYNPGTYANKGKKKKVSLSLSQRALSRGAVSKLSAWLISSRLRHGVLSRSKSADYLARNQLSLPRRDPRLWGLTPGCLQKQAKQI